MARFEYDLIVIGAGIGGLATASFAAGLGKRVLLVEKERIGGSCTLKTCMPTKSLIRSGVMANVLQRAKDYGLTYQLDHYNADGVFPYINRVIADVNSIDTPESFNAIGINTAFGSAQFIDRHHVLVGSRKYSADRFIIATGSRPASIGIPGTDIPGCLDVESLFRLKTLPATMVVIGGGPAGVELGLALRLLGQEVTILEVADSILFREDREIVQCLVDHVKKLGLKIITGCKVKELQQHESQVRITITDSDGTLRDIVSDAVLMTIGRTPNIEGLNLEKAGVEYTGKGITVNRHLQTTQPNIFACGDVTGLSQNASMVEKQSLAAANNAIVPVFKTRQNFEHMVSVIFTEPPLARAGLTEEEAAARFGKRIKIYRYDYRNLRRAKMERQDYGMAKIICRTNGKIIGVHIWGERAEELAHEMQLLKATGKPLHFLHSVSHAYPTFAEGVLKRLGDMAYVDRMAGNLFVRLGLKLLPGFKNNLKAIKAKL
ncbi:MAG: NAD(P)/FAD-dependent oxidoreductase [Dehalogenimonas sp.]|uniref:NAD(P)/FAD-dependent oxidoreductase n=1 Tax=Candidatus Dehalogenimonas loeffleri TaxID=3127115 RepID=A0ABZ2J3H8_9CHLR|nr:NAD(P)/FAD-dependent oxidoreductase [Dehalogenimonas sp.]